MLYGGKYLYGDGYRQGWQYHYTESKFTYVPDGIKPPYVTIELQGKAIPELKVIILRLINVLTYRKCHAGTHCAADRRRSDHSVEANEQGIWRLELTTDLTKA